MPSPPPLLYDTYYHIYNRGNNREDIFVEERNYSYFLDLYAKYIEPITDTFAYCLLKNHFHFSIRIKSEKELAQTLKVSPATKNKRENNSFIIHQEIQTKRPLGFAIEPYYASQQFSNLFNAYAKTINKTYHRTGSLFQHPFGRVAISTDRQFWNVIAYIHQNPQKHNFVDDFRNWKWSSYKTLLSNKPTKLNRKVVMDWFGGRAEYLSLHEEWVSDAKAKWFTKDDYD